MKKRPGVGVGVLIMNDNQLLLGKRINGHGHQTWAPPGGHLEFGESIEECAAREVKEETGLEITNIQTCTFTNDIFQQNDKHYITIFVTSDYVSGEPQILEPEKCGEWRWFYLEELPEPLFLPMQNLVQQIYTMGQLHEW